MAAFLNGFSNIVCISGIGVREFYRKRGYVITTEHGYLKKQMRRLAPFVWIIKLLWWISNSWRVFHLIPNQMRISSLKIE